MGKGVEVCGKEVVDRLAPVRVVSRAGVAGGFVDQGVAAAPVGDGLAVAFHAVGGRVHPGGELADDGAVEGHASLLNEALGPAAGGQPRGGEEGVDAHGPGVCACPARGAPGYADRFAPRNAMLTHVVVVWFRKDAPADAVARFRARARADLPGIPGVKHLNCGVAIPSERPVVDKSYSVALSMTFDGPAQLDAYQVHPVHQKFSAECVRPVAERVVVYDFE